jgi:hypothetical protein
LPPPSREHVSSLANINVSCTTLASFPSIKEPEREADYPLPYIIEFRIRGVFLKFIVDVHEVVDLRDELSNTGNLCRQLWLCL